MPKQKYRINKGCPSTQCTWVVKISSDKEWNIIAEFWYKEDAKLFIKAKVKDD